MPNWKGTPVRGCPTSRKPVKALFFGSFEGLTPKLDGTAVESNMPNVQEKVTRVWPGTKKTVTISVKSMVSKPSDRKNGKLLLRANPHSRQNQRMLSFSPRNGKLLDNAAYMLDGSFNHALITPDINRALASLEAETYAKFRGKLYQGSAALGVTIGSWKQSREMIVNRYRQMSLQSDSFERRANSILRLRGRKKQIALDKLGGQFLEMVFGWKPLLADITASIQTVCQDLKRPPFVKASASTYIERQLIESNTPNYVQIRDYAGVVRVKRAAQVEVSNPNKWLQERAGLLNPLAVAWDLVPWSFVVNMFVNTGQLVNSITDFAGLKFINGSMTTAIKLTCHQTCNRPHAQYGPYGGQAAFESDRKFRSLDATEGPPLVFKLPEVNWELAGIAASLFFQKFRKCERLVNMELLHK